jgi:hypothetical protein
MNTFEKQCQSCGMPLENGKIAGTEKDGSPNLEYCSMCYKNGEFVHPHATLEDMKNIVDNALKEKGWIAPLRFIAKAQLPYLRRWKKQ